MALSTRPNPIRVRRWVVDSGGVQEHGSVALRAVIEQARPGLSLMTWLQRPHMARLHENALHLRHLRG
jgi:hypothetical protein